MSKKKTKELPQQELQEALEALVATGRCTEAELKEFSQKELEVLAKATLEYLEKGESLTIKAIEAADYLFEIPNIIPFVEDPYYLGNELGFLRDDKGKVVSKHRQIFDYWMERLDEIYNKGEHFNEVLITGAIGVGKTTFMNIIQLYDFVNLMALKEPQRHYGLMPSTVIVIAFFNILKDLASDVGYTQFQNVMDSSPFFRKIMYYNVKLREGLRYLPPHDRRISFQVGSRIAHTLGRAVFSAQMDEANFGLDNQDRRVDEKKSQVYENYVSLLNRRTSRFPTAPGHFCIGSSKRSTADFLEKHIDDSKGKPGVKVIDVAQYEAKRNCIDPITNRLIYWSGKTFRVLLGDLTREPKILDHGEVVEKELKDRVIEVPNEHREAYDKNIIEALRDISGIAAMPKQAFFTNRDLIRSLITERKAPWKYTSGKKTIPNTINVSFFGQDQIQNFLILENIFTDGGHLPYRRNPRYLAIDTGYAGDAAGISMVCRAGVNILEKKDDAGQVRRYYVPKYYPDFYIRIKGKNKEEFPLYKLTEFVKYLINEKNIPIRGMATDGFQSIQLQQDVKIAFPSLDVEQISVDIDDACYINLRNIVNAQAITGLYHDDNLLTEAFDLVHISKGGRGTRDNMRKMIVDHPTVASDGFIGRKDVMDSLASAVFLCREHDDSMSQEELEVQIEDFKKVDIAQVIRNADAEVDAALKEVDKLRLEDINFGDDSEKKS